MSLDSVRELDASELIGQVGGLLRTNILFRQRPIGSRLQALKPIKPVVAIPLASPTPSRSPAQAVVPVDGPLTAIVNPDIVGTVGADTLIGTANDEEIVGLAGNDRLEGRAGADSLFGGNGNDLVLGGDGADVLNGNGGNDTVEGGNGNDVVIVDQFSGLDTFDGGAGFDTIRFLPPDRRDLLIHIEGGFVGDGRGGGQQFTNFERVIAGGGNDRIIGDLNNNRLQGGAGDDTLEGGGGNDVAIVIDFSGLDTFDGGTGFDTIQFLPSDGRDLIINVEAGFVGDGQGGGQQFTNFEQIITGNGDDQIFGAPSNNVLRAGGGNDTVAGGAGNDTVLVTNFNGLDTFDGGTGFDTIEFLPPDGRDLVINVEAGFVGDGRGGGQEFTNFEQITGGSGNDQILGNSSNNTLDGGGGNDTLIGGAGQDMLIGGAGQDRFIFTTPADANDTISDFSADRIQINAVDFGGGLSDGPLPASQFVLGASAQDASDRFLYNQTTGALLFDADGTGSAAAITIATLSNQPELEASDIIVSGNAPQPAEFDIQVNFTDGNLTASQQALFSSAANRWAEIITTDIPDVFVPGFGMVDDIVIDASAPDIDGVGTILGQAGPTLVRSNSRLPARGIMEFDRADLDALEANGRLEDVILHEMGHVLGIGTIWEALGLLVGGGGTNPQFVGPNAVAEYNSIFGLNASAVPVENTGGPGTRDGHWRESVFGNELLTGFLNPTDNPISRITVGSLADIGYTVNLGAADPYTPPNIAPLLGPTLPGDTDGRDPLGEVFLPPVTVLPT